MLPHPLTQRYDREHSGLYHTRVLVQTARGGTAVARNTALMHSVADWAPFLADDATPAPDLLDAYFSAILRHDGDNTHPQVRYSHLSLIHI